MELTNRPRRLRTSPLLRKMVREKMCIRDRGDRGCDPGDVRQLAEVLRMGIGLQAGVPARRPSDRPGRLQGVQEAHSGRRGAEPGGKDCGRHLLGRERAARQHARDAHLSAQDGWTCLLYTSTTIDLKSSLRVK